jgi:hypothetical protein
MSKKKPKLEAKIVKHAHRRRFQEYVRAKGRDKTTIGYVYWNMFLRSGKGNVFELEEGLFLGDLGIGKNALRPARKTLVADGWLSKAQQKVDSLTGKWGTTAWTVNTEPVADSEGDGTDAPLTGDRSEDVSSNGDRSVGDTVVLHSLYASNPEASTSCCTPNGVTSTEQLVSQSVSVAQNLEGKKESKPSELGSGKTKPNPEEEDNRPPKPDYGDGIESLWSKDRWNWITSYDAYEELKKCFPAFKDAMPSDKEMRLMQEIIVRCDAYRVVPSECMKYAAKHKQDAPALIPRSVKALHKAVTEGSTTNGLIAQTKGHDPKTCGICKKELAALPCARCNGSTYGKPTIEHGEPFCSDCMKLPSYRRQSGQREPAAASI